MKFIFSLIILLSFSYSVTLTKDQLDLAKAAGYSKEDINQELSKKSSSKTNISNKEETNDVIKNDIEASKNLFKFIDNKNSLPIKTSITNKDLIHNEIDNVMISDIEKIQSDKDSNESFLKLQSEILLKLNKEEEIKRFGSLYFKNKNKINKNNIPTPQNYIINQNDQISINIFGSINDEYELEVNSSGDIIIPQIGEIKAIGLTFNKLKKIIKQKIKYAFPNTTDIVVNMMNFSAIQVNILGFVNSPGLYNLSSFSTIKDALINSGGILENGSYRNIKLKRNGTTIKSFDLYELIRYGKTSNDITLRNGDVVLVQPKGKEVTLEGEVNYSAKYELKDNENFRDLIGFAAGFKAVANKKAIKIKRFDSNEIKVLTLNEKKLFKTNLKNGDKITIYPKSNIASDLVTITGNVIAPGEREIPKDKKLSTLIFNELNQFGKNSYFKNNTNYEYAVIINNSKVKSFNLNSLLNKNSDLNLNKGDEIIIYSINDLQETPYIYADGIVVNKENQKYQFFDGMIAKDLFSIVKFKTEDIQENAQDNSNNSNNSNNSESDSDSDSDKNDKNKLRRSLSVDKTKLQITRVVNNKEKNYLISGENLNTFKLKKFDNVTFFEYKTVNNSNTALIKGEVFIPGSFEIYEDTTLQELIKLSGGLTKKALHSKFEIARYKIENDMRKREILSLNLKDALKNKLKIYPDDEITIFPIANWSKKEYVTLNGLVKFPGEYTIEKGEKLYSVIKRAGGFLDQAFIDGAIFTREEVQTLQEKSIKESLTRLKYKLISSNLDKNDFVTQENSATSMLETIKMLEEDFEDNKPIGRINIRLSKNLENFKKSPYNISLKNGDVISIPSKNDTVTVVGEVLNQNTFIYNDNLNIEDYIKRAGGLNDMADEELIYVIKANGESQKYQSGFFNISDLSMNPGDTIVVPQKIDLISDLSFAKDIASIVYQLAITAASIKTLGGL